MEEHKSIDETAYSKKYKHELDQYSDDFTGGYYAESIPQELAFSLIQYEEKVVNKDGQVVDQDAKPLKTQDKKSDFRDVLNSLVPPIPVSEQTPDLFKQVSSRAATREDVISLQQHLDDRLELRQARENGICPVREQLYAQTLDELIRQMTIMCPERGLLTVRTRDESRMTIAAYQTLYQTSLSFGMRKSLQAENALREYKKKVADLKAKREEVQSQVNHITNQINIMEKRHGEQRQIDNKKMNEEKEFIKHQRQSLETFLKTEQSKLETAAS